jgi:type 2 lantibiotic (TIGR03893 family)
MSECQKNITILHKNVCFSIKIHVVNFECTLNQIGGIKMSNEQIIKAWKNPELRGAKFNHPAGQAFNELSSEEMMNIQGAGDVQPETTPATIISTSSAPCIGGLTAGISISYSIKKC